MLCGQDDPDEVPALKDSSSNRGDSLVNKYHRTGPRGLLCQHCSGRLPRRGGLKDKKFPSREGINGFVV